MHSVNVSEPSLESVEIVQRVSKAIKLKEPAVAKVVGARVRNGAQPIARIEPFGGERLQRGCSRIQKRCKVRPYWGIWCLLSSFAQMARASISRCITEIAERGTAWQRQQSL